MREALAGLRPHILVVAAHADDEVLGAGGTIHHACVEWNAVVNVAIVAEGRASRRGDLCSAQIHEAANACGERLGVNDIAFGGLGADPNQPINPFETARFITGCLRKMAPQVLISHAPHDINIEHSTVNQAVTYSLTRTEFAESITLALEYEVPSSTERNPRSDFHPSIWVPLSEDDVAVKIEAFSAYEGEKEASPFGRSAHGIRALAAYRGMQIGASYCEAFQLARGIVH